MSPRIRIGERSSPASSCGTEISIPFSSKSDISHSMQIGAASESSPSALTIVPILPDTAISDGSASQSFQSFLSKPVSILKRWFDTASVLSNQGALESNDSIASRINCSSLNPEDATVNGIESSSICLSIPISIPRALQIIS